MADALPIKANFSGADPISLGEFQTGDTVPILNGGTGRTDGVVGAFKNKIINGNFGSNKYGWRGGTSGSGGGFVADRWKSLITGSGAAVSQQAFAKGQTDVPGNPWFFHRTVVTSAAGASNRAVNGQLVEDASLFAGLQATLSFYAKADASRPIFVEISQDFGTGGSPSTAIIVGGQKITLTSSWQKFTITLSIPSISGKTFGTNGDDRINVFFWYDAGSTYDSRTNNLGQQSGTFDLARVQFEEGAIATAFEDRPPAVEDILCRRYARKNGQMIGFAYTSAIMCVSESFNPPMRAAPSASLLTTTPQGESIPFTAVRNGTASSISGSHLRATGADVNLAGFTGMTVLDPAVLFPDQILYDAEI